jgi:hypothetical protein
MRRSFIKFCEAIVKLPRLEFFSSPRDFGYGNLCVECAAALGRALPRLPALNFSSLWSAALDALSSGVAR